MVLPIDYLSKIQIKIQGPLQIIKRFLDLCMVDNIGKQCFSLFPIRHYPSYFSFYFRFPIQSTYKLHSQLRSNIQLAALLGCDEIIKFKELFKKAMIILTSNIQVSASNTRVNAVSANRKCMQRQEIAVRKEYQSLATRFWCAVGCNEMKGFLYICCDANVCFSVFMSWFEKLCSLSTYQVTLT